MASTRAIPQTRFGRVYRVLLVVGGVIAIVGIAEAGRALFWILLNSATVSGAPLIMQFLNVGLRLAAWGLVAVTAYMGWRRNVIPPTWLLVSIPILGWALLLEQWFTR
jgi:hypothetical protein